MILLLIQLTSLCHFCSFEYMWEGGRMEQLAQVEMSKDAGTRAENKKRRRRGPAIPLEQVSPAVLTSTRDVAFTLQQLRLDPAPEEVLKAVLDRAAHLEEQASGITVFDD